MELELKFIVQKDYRPLLSELGFKDAKQKHLIDIYYLSDEKIAGVHTWLRIREDKFKNTASLDLHQLRSVYATEETEMSLFPADIAKLQKILAVLGLQEICVVDKQRQTYCLDNIEIALDEVKNLGSFIEIEIDGEENSENISKINQLVKKLGLSPENHIAAGYPDLIIENAANKLRQQPTVIG